MQQEGTQYQILDRIDVGGMAEIFRAKNLDTGEILAIKRILPALGQQPDFVDMFVDEAVICIALKHPNIVNVHQLGRMDNDLFLAMEYVAGINLRDLLNYANVNQFDIPIHDAVLIAIHILDGLQYAHNFKDAKGEPLNIIHRDISPPNILLGYNGDVKITDFGLVKAKTQMTRTVPGLIKGKFSYLSPEAAYGESIDSRSDLFAVGIILWEMLTRQPLFSDPVEVKILDLVRRCVIPDVRKYNSNVSSELDDIIKKGLSRTREGRFQTAAEFADALRHYYHSIGSPASTIGNIVAKVKPPVDPVAVDTQQPKASTVSQMIPIKEFEKAMQDAKLSSSSDNNKVSNIQKIQSAPSQTEDDNLPAAEEDSNKALYIAIIILSIILVALLIVFVLYS